MESPVNTSDIVDEDCNWRSGPCIIQSAMNEDEFNMATNKESMKAFARRNEEVSASFTSQDLLDALNMKKVSRTSLLSRIELNPVDNELTLVSDRSNIRARYGYDVGKQAYVYPEEALFLLESGKAEIFCNHVSLSVQRARSLLLVSQKEGKDRIGKVKHCTVEEYLVFKCLSRKGYCLYRYKRSDALASDESLNVQEEQRTMEMDEDDDIIIEENQRADNNFEEKEVFEVEGASEEGNLSFNQRNLLKRKHSTTSYGEEQTSSNDEMMDDKAELHSSSSYLGNDNDVNEWGLLNEPSGYTVDEADSDVEIVDEVIFSHGGVEIQEIAHSVGCQDDEFMEMSDEPVPSTSKGPQVSEVVVDLVSSEDEDEDYKEFERKIWGKFVPNAKVFFQVPPSKLIPQSMPSSDNVYEFDLKDKSDISDLELEFLVDEVSLHDDKHGMSSPDSSHINLSSVSSWKEWRQNMFQEARNVMNNSLLASSEYINGEAATEKLFLWGENQKETETPSSVVLNKVVFEMYGPNVHGYSRQQAFETKPIYYVLISRQDEPIPDFGSFGSAINGVPVLIAVVCNNGENDVLFMTADRSPLNSLF